MVTPVEAVGEGAHGADQGSGGAAAGGNTATALQLLQEFLKVQSARAEVYSRFNQGFRELLDHGQEAVFARLMHEVTPAFNAASQQVIHIESHLKDPAVNRPNLAALLRGVQEQERQKLKLTLSWQALRAAHASGRFSWQDAADRPRVHGAAAAAAGTSGTQQEHQQQQRLLSLLDQMQLETTGPAADACDVRAAANDQHAMQGLQTAAVKPGFYEQQMQRAVADAVAASASQEAVQCSSSSNAGASHGHVCGGSAIHGCQHSHSHGHDPLEPSPLEPTEAEFNAAVREALQELDVCVVGINDLLDEVREAVQELQEEAS